MPSPEVIDFVKLLAPVSADSPSGSDIRTDPSPVSDYQKIREARKAARNAERSLESPSPDLEERKRIAPPDWALVLDLGKSILTQRAKDLEVVAYMIEALVRLRRFSGLRDGYRLARELIEKYWEGLFPAADDPDTETRFKLLMDLFGVGGPGALLAPIRQVPMTPESSVGVFGLTDHAQAMSLNKVTDPKVRQQRIEKGEVALETIRQAVAESPSKFFVDLVDDLGDSIAEINRFSKVLREKSQYDAPSSEVVNLLQEYLVIIKDLARDKLPKPATAAGVVAEPNAAAAGTALAPAAPPGDPHRIRDRSDALDRLKKIADYFREHEPQSVIPFALEQAANWSKMSLPELLSELIPEEGARKNLFKQVGIKPPSEAKK
jgi:type VI secretion system protein ImpA